MLKIKAVLQSFVTRRSCCHVSANVGRVRRQQMIKEVNEECQKIVQDGHYLLYHRGKPFLTGKKLDNTPKLVTFQDALNLVPDLQQEAVFLKLMSDDTPLFAAMLPKESSTEDIEAQLGGKFTDMRAALFLVRSQWQGLMSGGSSLLRWLKAAKFCWSCKAPLERNASGCQLKCTNPECKAVFYPPTSPVGISLIAFQDHSKALLIRQSMYPQGMYSCCAGFVDPGESLADCVVRESAEEAGVDVDPETLEMVDSNHWPNPAGSLMCGCIVTTETTSPSPCSHEIEAVKWFSPEELHKAVQVVDKAPNLRFANKDPNLLFVPPKGAIANVIIRTWLSKYHGLQ